MCLILPFTYPIEFLDGNVLPQFIFLNKLTMFFQADD